ncbi:MAG: CapA family protein [Tissierellia bacterium]|nr:CapA family protein [Tissierellia bacterium]
MNKRLFLLLALIMVLGLGGLFTLNTYVASGEAQVQAEEAQLPEPKEEPKEIHMVAMGDFMLHQPQLDAAKTPEGYDFSDIFTHLGPYIGEADLAAINLETTLTDGSQGYTSFPVFSSPKEVAGEFKRQGIDLVATANNHCYDKGLKGLDYTLDQLEEEGLVAFGTSQGEENLPVIYEIEGIKLGLASYTYGLNGFDASLAASERPQAVNLIDREKIQADVDQLKDQGADLVLLYLHWGVEYQSQASEDQEALALELFDMGVDGILGSHPHVAQRVEKHVLGDKTHYVAYSMGNFVSNQRREYIGGNPRVESGLMMDMTIKKDPEGQVEITKFEPQVLWVDKFQDQEGLHYQVIPVKAALEGDIDLPRLDQVRDRLVQAQENFDAL